MPAQFLRDGRFSWRDTRICHACSDQGFDGIGPDWLRDAVLQTTGGVVLTLAAEQPARVHVLRILRRTYGGTVAETAAMLSDLLGRGLRITPAEAEFLTAEFSALGLLVSPAGPR
ncbi:hypothetical protein [Kitasatospora sp. NPDC091207]|uniref:hypothetical protein n=1 Tax=Kitasatospora sp. NPDC091207 TaxID=3364083 RepID=UPI003806F236